MINRNNHQKALSQRKIQNSISQNSLLDSNMLKGYNSEKDHKQISNNTQTQSYFKQAHYQQNKKAKFQSLVSMSCVCYPEDNLQLYFTECASPMQSETQLQHKCFTPFSEIRKNHIQYSQMSAKNEEITNPILVFQRKLMFNRNQSCQFNKFNIKNLNKTMEQLQSFYDAKKQQEMKLGSKIRKYDQMNKMNAHIRGKSQPQQKLANLISANTPSARQQIGFSFQKLQKHTLNFQLMCEKNIKTFSIQSKETAKELKNQNQTQEKEKSLKEQEDEENEILDLQKAHMERIFKNLFFVQYSIFNYGWRPQARESATLNLINGEAYLFGGFGAKFYPEMIQLKLDTFE